MKLGILVKVKILLCLEGFIRLQMQKNYTIDKNSNINCVFFDAISSTKWCEKGVFSHLLFYKFNSQYWLVVDSFNDKLELVCHETKVSVFDNLNYNDPYWGYYFNVFHRNKEVLLNNYNKQIDKANNTKFNFFVICPTYNCNSRCVYCYQQYNPLLDRRVMSEDDLLCTLNYIQENVDKIREKPSKQLIALGLFGGEPFIKKNKGMIERIMAFARKNKLPVLPTTNLQEIESFLDIFIKYRGYFGRICTTIDGDREFHNARRKSLITTDPFLKVVNNVNLLIELGIHVTVTINIDYSNKSMFYNFLQLAKDYKWWNNELVTLEVGRVDDRCYTGTSDDIMSEAQLLKYLYDFNKENELPNNIKLAFVKTSLPIAKRLKFDFNQNERGRQMFHYCWAGTPVDNIQYIDKNLNVYRCTYTVGRDDLALYNLRDKSVFHNIGMYNRSTFLPKCWECPLGGYCGGGCCVSSSVNQERFCHEELNNFDYLITELVIPIIKSKFYEYIK